MSWSTLALTAFTTSPLGARYAVIGTLWRRHWDHVRPVFAYPPDIRKLLYTTNAMESLHMQLRKIIKSRGHFPTGPKLVVSACPEFCMRVIVIPRSAQA